MPDPSILPAYLAAVLVILAAPGPDMMFMIASGLGAGRRGAVYAALGVTAGVSVYVIGSVVGLAALLSRSPGLLDATRLVGAAYLVHLGITSWSGGGTTVTSHTTGDSALAIFRRGFVVNITNPKVALFIAAFIPQFLGGDAPATTQLLVLALVFQVCGLVVDLIVGVAAGTIRHLLDERAGLATNLGRASAVVYLAIALWLLVELAT